MAITKADFTKTLSEKLGFSNREAKRFVEAFFGEITEVLSEGKCVKLSSFGNFMLRDKRARPGRNPRTGEPVTISPRRVVVFRPGPKLKGRVAFYDKGDGEQSVSTDT